jgi:hypothetical protein
MAECPVCHKTVTNSGYEFGTEFKQRCMRCSCGTYIIVNAETPEILKEKLEKLKENQIRSIAKQDSHSYNTEKKLEINRLPIGELAESIKSAWLELKEDELEQAIWWDEQELVLPFYSHLKSKIAHLNSHLKQTRLYLVPQYAEKASCYAEEIGKKEFPIYPIAKNYRKSKRSYKVDLAIIEFALDDFKAKSRNSKATYWHIKHKPLVLLEFKVATGKELLDGMQKDFEKLIELQKRYDSIERVYFCFVTDKMPSSKDLKTKIKHVQNLTLCYGTFSGEWKCTSPPT